MEAENIVSVENLVISTAAIQEVRNILVTLDIENMTYLTLSFF